MVLFGASFGIGLALTYALISSGSNPVVVEPGAASAEKSSSDGTRAPSVAIAPMQKTQGLPGAAVMPPISDAAALVDTKNDMPTAEIAPVEEKTEVAPVAENEKNELEVASNLPEVKASAPTVSMGWKDLKGKTCRVGLAEVGFQSLSLRRGKLRHGARVSWKKSFSKSRRIGKIQVDANPVVLVQGVGLDDKGRPAVAYVKIVDSGKKGVISLQVEGKEIHLFPILEAEAKSAEVN